jgi:hypothetical protein
VNLLNLRKAGARVSNGGRILEFDLIGSDGISHTHGFAMPEARSESDEFSADTANSPDPAARDFRDDDASTLTATRALFDFARFSKALGTIAADRLLSQDGKMAGVRAAETTALQALGTHYAKFQQVAPNLEAQGAKLLAVPNAEPAEAAWDVEIYKHRRSLDRTRQIQFELSLHEPHSAREALALKRTPGMLLSPDAQRSVAGAWESHVGRRQPAQWASYQTAKANFKWASDFVPYLARELRDPAIRGSDGALPRLDSYKILRPLAATSLLKFQDPEVQTFERVIASEAARQAAAA